MREQIPQKVTDEQKSSPVSDEDVPTDKEREDAEDVAAELGDFA